MTPECVNTLGFAAKLGISGVLVCLAALVIAIASVDSRIERLAGAIAAGGGALILLAVWAA